LLNVTIPTRAKAKGSVRTTGSLLAKEALQAARARLGGAAPAAPTVPLPTPKSEPEPQPEPEPKPPTVPLPTLETTPEPEPPPPEPEPESEPDSEPEPKPPAPPPKARSKIVLKGKDREPEPEAAEPPAPKARKTIRLTQPIALAPAAPEVKSPSLKIPEPSFTTGKILVGQMRTKPLSLGRRTISIEMRKAPPTPAPETKPPARQEPPASSPQPSTGELPAKSSLKIITSAIKPPKARTPVRLTTSLPYRPGDSGPVGLRTEESAPAARSPSGPVAPVRKLWGPESPASQPLFPSTAKITPPRPVLEPPRLDTRPPSTKIPVSDMPPEGLKVRSTRRLTGRIPVSEPPKPPVEPPPELPAQPLEPAGPPPLEISEPAPPVALPVTPPVAEALAAPPEIAPPEKARLRRPVKLELSSRKMGDSGRLTHEAFSKMAPVEAPTARPPSQFLPPLEVEAPPESESEIETQTETAPDSPRPGTPDVKSGYTGLIPAEMQDMPDTVPLATVEDRPPQRQRRREIKVLKVPLLPPRRRDNWLWVAYAIIAAGMLAWLLLLYLATHRQAPAPETPTPPAVSNTPPTPAPAPTSPPTAATPNPSPAPAAPATPAVPDIGRQVSAYVTDGIGSFQKGDLDSALAAFNHALELDPKSADALYNRGLTKAAQDDSDGAISDYSQALEINPKMAQAYYARGLARHAKSDLDGALSDYNLAIQNEPHDALAFFNRGLIRMQKDDVDGAVVDSSRALELDPRLIQSYYNRGLGRMAKGSLDASLNDMKEFCTLAPQDAYTDYARLYIWLIRTQQNQLAEANQELNAAMVSGWNGSADAMVTKIGQFLLGQISEQSLLDAAASPIPVKDQGQHCEAWYFIGMRRLESGDKETAAIDLRKCVETEKTDYCEYILAQEALKTLNPDGAPTSTVTPAP